MNTDTRKEGKSQSTSQTSDPSAMYKPAVAPTELPGHLLGTHARRPSWREVAGGRGMLVEGLLTPREVQQLQEALDDRPWQPVGLDGIASNHREGDQVGSWRLTSDAPSIAAELWKRLATIVPAEAVDGRANPPLHAAVPLDTPGPGGWRACGINPRLRFIRYLEGGLLVPHYDGPYIDPHGERSLITLVVYLGKRGEAQGGATRFIYDDQERTPLSARDLSDWTRSASPHEVLDQVDPPAGSALLFWHRLLHDSEPITGSGDKTIIRSDVMFRPC